MKCTLATFFPFSASNVQDHLVEQNVGNISAPLQSPAVDLNSLNSAMTRSRSLNSPLVNGATGTCCQHMDHPASTRNKRRHSGIRAIKKLLELIIQAQKYVIQS